MAWWGGLFLSGAALLVVSGVAKLRSPGPTRQALRAARLPSPPGTVTSLALVEVVVGALALLTGRPLAAALVGASYASYAIFVLAALRRPGRREPCGCFGGSDTPPTVAHLGVTVGLAATAGWAAVAAGPGGAPAVGLMALGVDGVATAVVVVGYAALSTWLLYLVLDVLPRVRPSRPR